MQALEAPGHQNAHKLLNAKVEEAQESVETPEIHIALERTQGEYLEP